MASKKEKIIEKAQKLLQKGSIDKAAIEYQKAVELDPGDVTTRLRLGDLYVKLGNQESAIKEYTEVAKVHTNKGFYLKAIAVYKQMIKLDEEVLDYRAKLADLYAKQNLLADAIREYSHIIAIFEKKNKTNEVLEMLKKMMEIDSNNIGVRLKLADYYLKLKYEKDALAEYKIVADKLNEQGKKDKVEKLYAGLYKALPRNELVLQGIVEVYKDLNNVADEVRYSKELVNIYKEQEKYEEAISLCEDILRIDPTSTDVIALINEIKPGYDSPLLQSLAGGSGDLGTSGVGDDGPLVDMSVDSDFGSDAPSAPGLMGSEPDEAPLIDMPDIDGALDEPEELTVPAEKLGKGDEATIDFQVPDEEEPLIDVQVDMPVDAVEDLDEIEDLEPIEELEEIEEITEEIPSDVAYEETSGKGSDEGSFIDLSAELGLDEAFDALLDDFGAGGEELKEGFDEQRASEDSETHYNLGIAYMEMELYEEASNEFKVAKADPAMEFDCLNRLGMCAITLGNNDDAIITYLQALKVEGVNADERKGSMYELGLAYESAGRVDDAHGMYKTIFEMDPTFREVAEKYNAFEEEAKKKLTH